MNIFTQSEINKVINEFKVSKDYREVINLQKKYNNYLMINNVIFIILLIFLFYQVFLKNYDQELIEIIHIVVFLGLCSLIIWLIIGSAIKKNFSKKIKEGVYGKVLEKAFYGFQYSIKDDLFKICFYEYSNKSGLLDPSYNTVRRSEDSFFYKKNDLSVMGVDFCLSRVTESTDSEGRETRSEYITDYGILMYSRIKNIERKIKKRVRILKSISPFKAIANKARLYFNGFAIVLFIIILIIKIFQGIMGVIFPIISQIGFGGFMLILIILYLVGIFLYELFYRRKNLPKEKKIQLNDKIFNKTYDVFCEDEIEVGSILTPKMQSQLLELEQKTSTSNVNIAFIGDEIYLYLKNSNDNLEISLKEEPEVSLEKFLLELSVIFSFLELINLEYKN
ncbi:DUF3137 domain-containing protein [Candidatus Vampirococcus lugosii]|uniref:DUF3137 domain-containing protein n=1 Tax=Candidatus Vampirococcus lugosii TaxID=2789015 RepID=A0ABS5QL65_9BACT|nr:DUF3137 domain-containing protein [Candidatus Vampirococcus lugosii]MBS8121912.1 hypothetical protein [Candidatus Vampirococcus lugosii]